MTLDSNSSLTKPWDKAGKPDADTKPDAACLQSLAGYVERLKIYDTFARDAEAEHLERIRGGVQPNLELKR